MVIVFYSNKKNITWFHYLKEPKSAIETKFIKVLENNPSLNKQFQNHAIHPINYILFKYWINVFYDGIALYEDWVKRSHQQPSRELLERNKYY